MFKDKAVSWDLFALFFIVFALWANASYAPNETNKNKVEGDINNGQMEVLTVEKSASIVDIQADFSEQAHALYVAEQTYLHKGNLVQRIKKCRLEDEEGCFDFLMTMNRATASYFNNPQVGVCYSQSRCEFYLTMQFYLNQPIDEIGKDDIGFNSLPLPVKDNNGSNPMPVKNP